MVHLIFERIRLLADCRNAHCEGDLEMLDLPPQTLLHEVFLAALAVLLDEHRDLVERPQFKLHVYRGPRQLANPHAEIVRLTAFGPRLKGV